MSDHQALRWAAWVLALYLGPEDDHEMSDGAPVAVTPIPALMHRCAHALQRALELRSADLVCIADLRKRLDEAERERDIVARELARVIAAE